MCSIAIPIIRDGTVAGVVGIDLDLSEFIETMNSSHILGDGYLFVLSPGGLIATHPKQEFIMQPFGSIAWIKEYDSQFDQILKTSGNLDGRAFSDVLQDSMQFRGEAVMIGDTGRYWLVCGVIPEETAASASNQLLWVIILIGIALFVVVGIIAYIITKRSLAPLIPLTAFLRKAGETGDILLKPQEVENIKRITNKQDELGLCVASASSFIGHVNKISEVLGAVADGDLTVDIQLLSGSDTMWLSLKKMISNLNNMFQEISTASSQVSTGAGQVADGAQALAAGSTQQAASIEELSGSIAEMAEKTQHNAGMADQAARLADVIKSKAEKGSRQMDEMITAVKDINESSHSISKIIKTIDDIAFQTNILALNAAVEAARAGQHGKGFAVVADEVRNLASKSADAANETANMIADSMEKAKLGVNIAGETAASLSEIVSGINESNSFIADIAKASEEQSMNISQINDGIDQVAQVVQQNSATAEESAAASEEMSGQSTMLKQLISQFRLNDTNTTSSDMQL
jgi:methyl-accepting chemotaxis protein